MNDSFTIGTVERRPKLKMNSRPRCQPSVGDTLVIRQQSNDRLLTAYQPIGYRGRVSAINQPTLNQHVDRYSTDT